MRRAATQQKAGRPPEVSPAELARILDQKLAQKDPKLASSVAGNAGGAGVVSAGLAAGAVGARPGGGSNNHAPAAPSGSGSGSSSSSSGTGYDAADGGRPPWETGRSARGQKRPYEDDYAAHTAHPPQPHPSERGLYGTPMQQPAPWQGGPVLAGAARRQGLLPLPGSAAPRPPYAEPYAEQFSTNNHAREYSAHQEPPPPPWRNEWQDRGHHHASHANQFQGDMYRHDRAPRQQDGHAHGSYERDRREPAPRNEPSWSESRSRDWRQQHPEQRYDNDSRRERAFESRAYHDNPALFAGAERQHERFDERQQEERSFPPPPPQAVQLPHASRPRSPPRPQGDSMPQTAISSHSQVDPESSADAVHGVSDQPNTTTTAAAAVPATTASTPSTLASPTSSSLPMQAPEPVAATAAATAASSRSTAMPKVFMTSNPNPNVAKRNATQAPAARDSPAPPPWADGDDAEPTAPPNPSHASPTAPQPPFNAPSAPPGRHLPAPQQFHSNRRPVQARRPIDRDLDEAKFAHILDPEERQVAIRSHKQHLRRMQEMEGSAASEVEFKHLSQYLPAEVERRFAQQMQQLQEGKRVTPASSAVDDAQQLSSANKGYQMLQRSGWSEGQGLGAQEHGQVAPVQAAQRTSTAGLGVTDPTEVTGEDDIYSLYRKKLMVAYQHRSNPLNNPRRKY
ncbi:hypothetical protein CAOG_06943 [Capsaspora owczarzaki ATCC 30864]|uniref:G-patch domain-containing protein n=1 Tax=Capsaspora owczarzaki (strain ATCC 30864) TaxID=595528 RepID=A0A0D2WW53_CAPO3|nr:hypothetical protein CAOG_06943 [Capsaspora owczarzaki ATCC 30864]KJE96653.1 hypothetical protein CAOG_006943 [Capsaspora owczarzaki ATCC 30864]|eukprot:XP_004343667.2 hypothetical protein CAOG_06943 [Capsaspora owczarzaki ATCC 30864]